jgi:hypothetical protein
MTTLHLTDGQWWAVRAALDQYVENGDEARGLGEQVPNLDDAEVLLDAMNAELAALAERARDAVPPPPPHTAKRPLHTCDEDCAGLVDETGCCSVCGVSHTGLCPECHGTGFHRPGCPESDEEN